MIGDYEGPIKCGPGVGDYEGPGSRTADGFPLTHHYCHLLSVSDLSPFISISSCAFYEVFMIFTKDRLDMTLAVAEALNPNKL